MTGRIVIWGLRKRYHTHRHIHQAFYKNAKKLGYKTLWLEDEKKNQKYLRPGDLVIASEVHGKMVPQKLKFEDYHLPVRSDIKYCLHNFQDIFKNKLKPENYINLAVYSNSAEKSAIKIDTARYFDPQTRTLYQPWGTDLLGSEFRSPVFNKNSMVFWIGSIWNNDLDQGNLKAIEKLKETLSKHRLKFVNLRYIPDRLNIFFTRKSRIAPAIAGQYQVEVNYLPCRLFKNISYGQLGLTNVKKFQDILGDSFIDSNSIEELIERVLGMPKKDYIEKVKAQQEVVKNYTYQQSLENIIKSLN